ncbi:MAG: FecR domain-containing protein [Holophagales bacterium]|nr:FecR domain-containing protein [Holophagales bacterium]
MRAIEGELFRVAGATASPLEAGATLAESERIRTGAGSRAVLELADGSRVELAPRSELELASRRDGVALELGRGNVIVEAAKQRDGHLYVATGDCEVSVVGTIFSVAHGAKGSRVSVIEGEVRVAQGARRAVLKPGDQLSTSDRLGRVPVGRDFAWSRNAADYAERLQALRALGRELDETLAVPGERTSTRLLDLAPAGTVVYAGLPNLSGSLAQAWTLVQTRVAENPALAAWWAERIDPEREAEIERGLAELVHFGGYLGAEIAVAVGDDGSGPDVPLLLAEALDTAALSTFLDEEIARLNGEQEDGGHLMRIEDPAAAAPADGDTLFVWLAGDVLAVSPDPARLVELQTALSTGASGFAGGAFHGRLASVYAEGAGWLLGFDLGSILSHETSESDRAALERSGFSDLDYLVLESESAATGTEMRAQLAFAGERHGIASWLAEPGPLGALEFVSPDAPVAVAGLLKDPEEMFDDVLAMLGDDEGALAELARFEAESGLSLRQDIALSLGGDFAFAVDGPWLPTPAWKLVIEVHDPARLSGALERLVEAFNRALDERTAAGEPEQPHLAVRREEVSGHVVVSIERAGVSLASFLVHDGYLVAAPQVPLLIDTVARREAGISLAASAEFRELLPRDGRLYFSAVAWQRLAGELSALGQLAAGAGISEEERGQLEALVSEDEGPSLAVVYGDPDQVTLATSGLRGPLGISLERLLALGTVLSSAHAAEESAHAPRDETPREPTA